MGRCARAVACTGLAVLSAGCFWTAPGQDADRQGFNSLENQLTAATVGSLTEAWTVQLDEGPAGDPVTSSRGVHVSDTRSAYAMNPASGAELWQYSVAAPRVMGQPFVRGNQVLVGSALTGVNQPDDDDASTTILDATTGAVSGGFPNAIRALRGSRALSVSGRWEEFGIISRFWVWSVFVTVTDLDTSEAVYPTRRVIGGGELPSVNQNVTLGPGSFYLTIPAWPGGAPCPVGLIAHDMAAPLGPCSSIYVQANWAINETGSAPALSDDQATVYFAGSHPDTFADTAKAVDAATGSVLWSGPLPADPLASPSLAYGKLYVPTANGQVVVFDAAGCGASTCQPLWTASTGTTNAIVEQPAIAGGVVYTASSDGTINAFDAAGCATPPCAPIWSAATGSPITGAPAVSNGRLYVGTEDGRLIAYGLPTDGRPTIPERPRQDSNPGPAA